MHLDFYMKKLIPLLLHAYWFINAYTQNHQNIYLLKISYLIYWVQWFFSGITFIMCVQNQKIGKPNVWEQENPKWPPKQGIWFRFMEFKATFNNISVISWRSVLLVEDTGVNHRSVASDWQILSHNVISSKLRHERGSNSQR
jgi:hypothetical protein